jgi:hypothetical protein
MSRSRRLLTAALPLLVALSWVPAAAGKTTRSKSSITKEQADALVWNLPEVKAWANYINTKTKGAVHAMTMISPETPETIEGKKYWSVGFYEDQPDHVVRWQSFLVRLDGKEILVDTDSPDEYLSLKEWRAKAHPMERIREPRTSMSPAPSPAAAGQAAPVALARALPAKAGTDETGHAESARIARSIESFRVFLSRLPNKVAAAHHRLELRPRDTPQSLQALAGRLGFPVPPSLAALLTEIGAFYNPDYADVWQTIELYPTAQLLHGPTGLVSAIEHDWGERPELPQWFNADARSRIDKQTAVFGIRYEDDDTHDYLYFDSRGRFDHLYFDQDDPQPPHAKLNSILSGKAPGQTLSDLLDDQLAAMRTAIAKED